VTKKLSTPEELERLKELNRQGYSNYEIKEEFGVSDKTVRNRLEDLGLKSKAKPGSKKKDKKDEPETTGPNEGQDVTTTGNNTAPNELSSDLNIITAEINSYKQVAGQAVFEIGRRLKHVREQKLAEGRGGWTVWLNEIDISTSQAYRFIKVVEEYETGKLPHVGNESLRTLSEIATLPEAERDKEHEIPSTGETKKPGEMTDRELQELKRKLKETEKRAKEAEQRAEAAENKPPEKPVYETPEEIKERLKELEEKNKQMDAELSKSYSRIRELEQLEKSVQNQTESPLYDAYRALVKIDTHLAVFNEDPRHAQNMLANSDQEIIDKLKNYIDKGIKLLHEAKELVEEEQGGTVEVLDAEVINDDEYDAARHQEIQENKSITPEERDKLATIKKDNPYLFYRIKQGELQINEAWEIMQDRKKDKSDGGDPLEIKL